MRDKVYVIEKYFATVGHWLPVQVSFNLQELSDDLSKNYPDDNCRLVARQEPQLIGYNKPFTIISGGQTGADRGALYAVDKWNRRPFEGHAPHVGTGGWMPKGFLAEDGKHPDYAGMFGMVEHESANYAPRTYLNVKESDATIRIASSFKTAGEKCTRKAIMKYGKRHRDIDVWNPEHDAAYIFQFIKDEDVRTLNVAGNAESKISGIQDLAEALIYQTLEMMNENGMLDYYGRTSVEGNVWRREYY